jgi:hypothetical protein
MISAGLTGLWRNCNRSGLAGSSLPALKHERVHGGGGVRATYAAHATYCDSRVQPRLKATPARIAWLDTWEWVSEMPWHAIPTLAHSRCILEVKPCCNNAPLTSLKGTHREIARTMSFIFATPEALARPPVGLDFALREVEDFATGAYLDIEAGKARCAELLGRLHDTMNPATRHLYTPGSGVGILLEHSPFCHHIERDGVSAVFAGEVGGWAL